MKLILKLPLIGLIFLSGCANLISNFDQNSYQNAASFKMQSLALIDKSNESSSFHQEDIVNLQDKLSFALAYEKGKGKAGLITYKQWDILANPSGSLLGSYLDLWKNGAVFSPEYISEKRIQINDGWDEIINLESSKTK